MLRVLETVGQVVDALGGPTEVARRYSSDERSLTTAAVTNWCRRGRITANLYLLMRAHLKEMGCTAAPDLWNMRQPDGEPAPCEAASA